MPALAQRIRQHGCRRYIGFNGANSPGRLDPLVQEWAMMHREELELNWRLCRENARPANIDPLP
jgi:hypothetical protein